MWCMLLVLGQIELVSTGYSTRPKVPFGTRRRFDSSLGDPPNRRYPSRRYRCGVSFFAK